MQNVYSSRKYIIIALFILIGLVFMLRLFYIQVIDQSYKLSADNNVIRHITQYPARGLIYDRNGQLLVHNEAVYDLRVIPRHVSQLDTAEFCRLVGISVEEFNKKMNKAKAYSYYKPTTFVKQLSKENFGYLEEKMYKYPGFYVQHRTVREYPISAASQILGYVGEVTKKGVEEEPYYKAGDYIGISGIEKFYEEQLRGKKGKKIMLVDVFNRIKGNYEEGRYDTAAIAGENLYTTIDIDLQSYGEKLLKNKKGGIVALEPATGEILAIVSSPTYNPNLLVGRIRTKNYKRLSNDELKPLFNRAIQAKYPPGSTFKTVNALIGMQDSVLSKKTYHSCNLSFYYSGVRVGCHVHKSPLNLMESIQYSCNTYYCKAFRSIINQPRFENTAEGLMNWRKYVLSFGIGRSLYCDLPDQSPGFLPTPAYYNRYYNKNGWRAITIISLAIGQGEVLATPLQMANQAAIIANKGYYITPHIVKAIGSEEDTYEKYSKKRETLINKDHFPLIIEGMQKAVEAGTAPLARIDSIVVCGKTGTSQNPHGEDHSVFIAFAPKVNPKIAIACVVENAGYGGSWAAPIASLMIEKYLKGHVNRKNPMRRYIENRILKKDLIHQKEQ